ncbi:MAG: tRNA adenosine(34) deaminase TadA [Pseudomonadales bacterium]|nr:tRNA adenosine(34) deaminase TadA [Pseudomonadales bacterium]
MSPAIIEDADAVFMERALALAARGAEAGEVPVGALVVRDGEVLGEGWNQPISAGDPTAHAEIVALRAAATRVGNYRLTGATLYVTIEPCTMCAGALVHARIARLVYGAEEPRAGAVRSALAALETPGLNHRVEVTAGVAAAEAAALMTDFFRARRTTPAAPGTPGTEQEQQAP